MTFDELLARVEEMCSDYKERAQTGDHGYVDPSPEDLRAEETKRYAFGEMAQSLEDLLEEARPAAGPPGP